MTEPVVQTAVVCGTLYVSCHALGAEPAALVLAMLGAVGATMFVDALNDLKRTYGAVLLSTLLGGYGAPAALALTDLYVKRKGIDFPVQTLTLLAPLMGGAAIVICLPYVVTEVPRFISWIYTGVRGFFNRGAGS